MRDGEYTHGASKVLEAVSHVDLFPLYSTDPSGTIIRGEIGLANSLLALPRLTWHHTSAVLRGAPRLRFASNRKACPRIEEGDGCLASQMVKFSKSKGSVCPSDGCTATNGDTFERLLQKMVDTLMVCDLLHIAKLPCDRQKIIVATDDWDVLPGIAAAAEGNAAITWIRRNHRREQSYDGSLSAVGVHIENWGRGNGS